jgi:predicted alpha/beta hydrolase
MSAFTERPVADRGAPEPEPIELQAVDGYRLSAWRYRPLAAPRAHLVLAGATAVPQRFYRRFAQYAAERGFDTLTLDYRGIGESRPATLKGFQMDYLDWARLDLAAAVEHMRDDTQPLYMVGHSYGGHAFGLLPNHAHVRGFVTFATGAGWHGWMPRMEALRVRTMWSVLGPLMTRWSGYLPWSRLGMGEDLPLDVYRQWRHWCRFPNYFFDDPAMQDLPARFGQVRTPIVAVNATDDAWAPPRSRDAFMAGYRSSAVQRVSLEVGRGGFAPIGHMGYFRPAAWPLWSATLDWFEERTSAAADTVAPFRVTGRSNESVFA